MERYILTRSVHFGHLKESFGKGAVIQFDPATRKLTIDGRAFDDYRDVEILKRQSLKSPSSPWLIPYTEQELSEIRGGAKESAPAVQKRSANGEGMPIIQSDEDMHDTIDIRDTKVSVRNQEREDAERQRVRDDKMEIVQGYESVEDRIAKLKERPDSDLSARAERVRLMSERQAKMPIIHDDSLGSSGGSKSAALNAGAIVGGRRAEESPEHVKAIAQARKREVEGRRRALLESEGLGNEDIEVGKMPEDKDAEIARLMAALEPPSDPEPVDPRDAEIARLRAMLAEKTDGVRRPKRMPVIDADMAESFTGV